MTCALRNQRTVSYVYFARRISSDAREDNADLRLTEIGRELGLVETNVGRALTRNLRISSVSVSAEIDLGNPVGGSCSRSECSPTAPLSREASGEDLLRRPEMTMKN